MKDKEEYVALIAIDWADKKHDVSLLDISSGTIEVGQLKQKSEAIETWALALRKRFQGKQVALIFEYIRGGLLYALMKYDFIVLYPVNAITVAKYREAFVPSGAKDDPTDTEFMLEILLKHRDRLKVWKPDTAETRELQLLVEGRRKLVNDRKRLGNRLTSLLKAYYPQVLELFPKMGRAILCDFIIKYPTIEAAKEASERELITFFRSHNSGKKDLLKKRIEIIKKAIPLTNDQAIISSSVLMATSLAQQILAIVHSTEEFDKKIESLYCLHEDKFIFDSLPASGDILAPRLLAALGTDRDRFYSAAELQKHTGIAPVVERSGNQCWIHWRFKCNKFLRQSFIEWAGVTIKHSLWARAYYAMQRLKGKDHSMAVRALAYKWLRIIFRLWKDRKTYSEASYLESLQRSGSPIIAFMAKHKNLDISAINA